MSEGNVEIARAAIEAWNAGDMDRLHDLYDPDAVARNPTEWVEAGPYVGRDAVMEQFGQLRGIFGDRALFDRVEFLDAGDLVVVSVDFHSGTRGLPLTTEMAWVYTVRNGLITQIEIFRTREEALEAAGVSE